MKNLLVKTLLIGSLGTLLCACNGFFDKDNTPIPTSLTSFRPEAKTQLGWYKSVNYGVGSDYLKLLPAITETAIYTVDKEGSVTATDKQNGATLWKVFSRANVSAGPAAGNGMVFVGTRHGKVIALRQSDGAELWNAQVPSEVLSPPTAANGLVLVKTIDGQLTALSDQNGRAAWHYKQTEPALILRGGSAPQVTEKSVVTGFANGNLSRLEIGSGDLIWEEVVAIPEGSFAIQRMVDIDADPVIYKNRVYVATYQGRISALDLATGKSIWTHNISSFTGLTVDNNRVYVSDAASHIWAFDCDNGQVIWRQTDLAYRNITGPANIGNYIVVADNEGYLHWLSKQDGHFVARNKVNGFGILAAPVVSNNVVYVLTKDGHLASYTLT